MTVYLVGAGPGDPGLLTRRGAKLVSQADVVIFDRLVHRSLLALAPSSAELVDVGKRPDAAQSGTDRQAEINRLLVVHGRQSQHRGAAQGRGPVRVRPRRRGRRRAHPGRRAVAGRSRRLFGVRGTGRRRHPRHASWPLLIGDGGDGPGGGSDGAGRCRLGPAGQGGGNAGHPHGDDRPRAEIADALQRGGKPADTPTAVIERGTTSTQRVVRTTLDRLADVDLGSPAVIVVGPVAALGSDGAPVDPPGPLAGRTVVVTRSGPRAHGLVDALQRAGAETIEVPLTEQTEAADGGAALRDGRGRGGAVPLGRPHLGQRRAPLHGLLRDARALGSTKVAAVGPATAVALRRAGVEPDLVPAEHWALGLVDAFPAADLEHGRSSCPVSLRRPGARRPSPTGWRTRGGTFDASRPIERWPSRRPSPRSWPGWPTPMR